MDEILKISQFINPTLGFFSHMTYDFEYMEKEQLDIMFYGNYGDKNPAPIVLKTLPLEPTIEDVQKLATIVEKFYTPKWNRLKALNGIQYDPIHNYEDKLTESVKDVGSGGNTTGGTFTDKGTDTLSRDATRTDNLKSASQLASDVTTGSNTTDGIYGFDSVNASDAEKSVTSGTEHEVGTNTIDNTGTQKNVSVDTDTIDKTKTSAITIDNHSTNDRTRTSTHSGNIGNLTTQQLMKQEIELWKWNFINNVLADLSEFTTLPIYLS
jgi:hypothetical protein